MANNNISSPGIYINEVDQSFLAEGIISVGAAIVGPTAKGPVESPTVVTSYAEYVARFGELYDSGSNSYSFFNNSAAYNYFTNGGSSLLVTRVANGDATWKSATAAVANAGAGTDSITSVINRSTNALSGSIQSATISGSNEFENNIGGHVSSSDGNTDNTVTATLTLSSDGQDVESITVIDSDGTFEVGDVLIFPSGGFGSGVAYADSADGLDLKITLTGTVEVASGTVSTGSNEDILTTTATIGAQAFKLNTFAQGTDQNSDSNGDKNNIKYEIKNANTESGTFTLEIRRGDDSADNKITLEQFFNCNLDPYDDNYIGKVVGTQFTTVEGSGADVYVQVGGEYTNRSKYVYVSDIDDTPNFLDANGDVRVSSFKDKVPTNTSGNFTGGTGTPLAGAKFGKDITADNIQGVAEGDYTQSFYLLNDPKYQYTALAAPGLNYTDSSAQLDILLDNAKDRQDYLAIVDLAGYTGTVTGAVGQAQSINNSYAASYYPWLLASEPATGKAVWAPPSTFIPGVFAFNDKVGEPWFAPAGLNRGALPTVLNTARSLTKANRDTLYDAKVNPITAFPGAGIVVFGQKTLQNKASALDRINVRRLLITIKQFLDSQAGNIVFEQNTVATRNNFLAIVNPYLESVQQRQGLYAFKVIMDDSINTPAVIDRNQLVGQFYLQPTRTAEFIILNFNVQPTGASFPE